MTPHAFKDSWINNDYPLSPISASRLVRFNLNRSTVEFLTIAGLPVYTEPYLRFANDTDDITYGIHQLKEVHETYQDADFEKYVIIGSCHDGDAIAINTEQNDIIEQLDHRDCFESEYFNSSITTLADFLIIYRDFEASVLEDKNPDDSFQCYNFTDTQFEYLKRKMLSIDDKALTENGFWKSELAMMLSLREEYYPKP